MKTFFIVFYCCLLFSKTVHSQYADIVGSINCTAIHKDSSVFIFWADSAIVERGKTDISSSSLELASYGTLTDAFQKADNQVISLGDAGEITLYFSSPISDEQGFDFAVFENSFNNTFLELAFVEVSSNGIDFIRFPSHSLMQFQAQIGPFDNSSETSKINNLAGKYRSNFGTPFDLNELQDSLLIDIQNIHYVRIIDVVGQINGTFTSFDAQGNPINDPFPTPFESCGFDFDALGVIHSKNVRIETVEKKDFHFTNPVKRNESIIFSKEIKAFSCISSQGKIIFEGKVNDFSTNLPTGIYYIIANNSSHKLIIL